MIRSCTKESDFAVLPSELGLVPGELDISLNCACGLFTKKPKEVVSFEAEMQNGCQGLKKKSGIIFSNDKKEEK